MSLRVELSLREKTDRDGAHYLFAPIPAFNFVCFVYDEPPRANIRRAKLVLKPYEPGRGEFRASWEEEEGGLPPPSSSPRR